MNCHPRGSITLDRHLGGLRTGALRVRQEYRRGPEGGCGLALGADPAGQVHSLIMMLGICFEMYVAMGWNDVIVYMIMYT